MRNYSSAACLTMSLVLAGCAAPAPGSGGAQSTPPTLATISGPVAFIDGKPVEHVGKPVQVPPGSHAVRTATKFVHSTSTTTVWYEVPAADFVLPTRAGFDYYVERQILETTAPTSPVRLLAYERDAAGRVVQTFAPTQNVANLRATRLTTPQ